MDYLTVINFGGVRGQPSFPATTVAGNDHSHSGVLSLGD
jgi:hypothetical protein